MCAVWRGSGKRRQDTRSFGTTSGELLALGDWLAAHGITHIALESTGVYWKPVYNMLEGARHRKQPFAKFVGADSDREDGLQLADRVVGAVRHQVVEGNSQHFTTFAHKVADLWKAP